MAGMGLSTKRGLLWRYMLTPSSRVSHDPCGQMHRRRTQPGKLELLEEIFVIMTREENTSLNAVTCFSLSVVPQMHALKEKEPQNSQMVVEMIIGNISGWLEWQTQSSTPLSSYMHTNTWSVYIQTTHCMSHSPKLNILQIHLLICLYLGSLSPGFCRCQLSYVQQYWLPA